MKDDDPRFLRLARSILDGTPVDWEAARNDMDDDEEIRVLESLRAVESIARSGESQAPGTSRAADLDATHDSVKDRDRKPKKPASSKQSQSDRVHRHETPQRWGHLEIRKTLGAGAYGQVYLAWESTLEREVALKLLHLVPGSGTSQHKLASHVLQEGRNLARVRHPNVVTVYGAEEIDGRVGLWMEYIQGSTLEDLLQERVFGAREVANIGIELCRALTAVHQADLVHRDVKARNVMRETGGRIVLMDFGAGLDRKHREDAPAMAGTPVYLAPEIFQGQAATAQSDIYSLGVLLFHLVTGSFPAQGSSLQEIWDIHKSGSARLLRELRADLPESFLQVIERALAFEPSARFASAGQMEHALALALQEQSFANASFQAELPVTRGQRARRFLALGATLAVATAVAVGLWMDRRPVGLPPEERALAVVDFQDLSSSHDATFSSGLMGLLQVGLMEASPCRVVSPERLHDLRRRLFNVSSGPISSDQALEVARQSGASTLLTGQMGQIGDSLFSAWRLVDVHSGEIVEARRADSRSLAPLCDRMIGEILPSLRDRCRGDNQTESPSSVADLTTASSQAYRHYVAGLLARDEQRWADAVREQNRAIALDSTFALAYFALSQVGLPSYDPAKVRQAADKAWALRERLGLKDRLRLEAWRAEIEGRLADVKTTYREILTRWPDDREALSGLTTGLFNWWNFDEAAVVGKQGLDLYPDDASMGIYYQTSLRCLGRLDEAVEMGQQYIEQYPDNPNAWDTLGWHYLSLGLPDSAEAVFHKALSLDGDFVFSKRGLSACAYARGQVSEAIFRCQRILEEGDLATGVRAWVVMDMLQWPGLVALHAEAGRYTEALEHLEELSTHVLEHDLQRQIEDTRNDILLMQGRAAAVLESARTWARRTDLTSLDRFTVERWRVEALTLLDSLAPIESLLDRWQRERLQGTGAERYYVQRALAVTALHRDQPGHTLETLAEMERHGVPAGLVDAKFRTLKARAYEAAGRTDEAERTLRDLIDVYGGHARARLQLAKLLDHRGRPREAVQEYEAFLRAWSEADATSEEPRWARQRLDALNQAGR